MLYLIGTLPSMIAVGMNPFINAQGYSLVGMCSVAIGAAANLLLDPLFIFVFGLGVQGAAVATVLSQLLSASFVLLFLTKRAELRVRFLRKAEFSQCSGYAKNIVSLGTAGFIISTVAYAGIYKISGMEGLLITTVVMDIIAVVCSFFLRSESSKTVIADRKEVQILAIFKNKKAFLFVISLAIFSIAWLLINFFYVVKLENCGLPVEWMSLIILSYSAVQMLSEPILGKLSDGKNGKSGRGKLPAVTAAAAGVAFLFLGVVKFRAAVLLLMLILPLLLNLPEYLLMNLENQFVDEAECGSQRAATLSVLNMGVNLVEILTLSASAFLTKIGIQWCFVFVGCFLMAIALLFARIQK